MAKFIHILFLALFSLLFFFSTAVPQGQENGKDSDQKSHKETQPSLAEITKPSNWVARGGCWDVSKNVINAQAIVGSCKLYYSRAVYKDFTFEVKLNKLAEGGAFGLLLRYDEQKDEGYICALLPSRGYFFAKIVAGTDQPYLSVAPVPFMNKGVNIWNTLKIVCQGDEFSLYLNGKFLSSITDNTYSIGRIGVIIGGDPRQRALFEILSLNVL